jgi:HEAT repeat protein
VTVRCKISPRVSFLIILITSLAGCLQEAPAPSAERTSALLISLLRDDNPETRRTAAESLGKIGGSAAASAILPLVTDPAPAVRAAAVQALGRLSSGGSTRGVLDALTRALEDPDQSVKQAASLAIGELEPASDQLEPVVDLVKVRDTAVRRAAVRVLLQVDAGRWLSALVPAVHDSDPEVRQGLVAVLGESGELAALAEIRKRLIEDSSPAVRAEAAYQLGKLGGSAERTALELASGEDSDLGVRRWAEAQLRSLRVPD